MEKILLTVILILAVAISALLYQRQQLKKIILLLSHHNNRKVIHPRFLSSLGQENLQYFREQIIAKYISFFNLLCVDIFPEEISRLIKHYQRITREKPKNRLILEDLFFQAISSNLRSFSFIIYSLQQLKTKGIKGGDNLNNFLIEKVKRDVSKKNLRELILNLEFLNNLSSPSKEIKEFIVSLEVIQKSPA